MQIECPTRTTLWNGLSLSLSVFVCWGVGVMCVCVHVPRHMSMTHPLSPPTLGKEPLAPHHGTSPRCRQSFNQQESNSMRKTAEAPTKKFVSVKKYADAAPFSSEKQRGRVHSEGRGLDSRR